MRITSLCIQRNPNVIICYAYISVPSLIDLCGTGFFDLMPSSVFLLHLPASSAPTLKQRDVNHPTSLFSCDSLCNSIKYSQTINHVALHSAVTYAEQECTHSQTHLAGSSHLVQQMAHRMISPQFLVSVSVMFPLVPSLGH